MHCMLIIKSALTEAQFKVTTCKCMMGVIITGLHRVLGSQVINIRQHAFSSMAEPVLKW